MLTNGPRLRKEKSLGLLGGASGQIVREATQDFPDPPICPEARDDEGGAGAPLRNFNPHYPRREVTA